MTHSIKVQELSITNMHCASCVSRIEKAVADVQDVVQVSVNFAERKITVGGDVEAINIIKAIANVGYTANAANDPLPDDEETSTHPLLIKSGIAFLVGIVLMFLYHPHGRLAGALVGLVTLITLVFCAGHIFKSALSSLKHKTANMHSLIALGTSAAWLYSIGVVIFYKSLPHLAQHLYFESAVMIVGFINLGAWLEQRARKKTSTAIKGLLGLQAKTARVLRDDLEIDLAIKDVVIDDVIRVRAGEKIPVDGTIIEGYGNIDESMLTGEPVLVHKTSSNDVKAGTINREGAFLLSATQIGGNTVLAQIIQLVRLAQNTKPNIARLVDKVASVFVPIVIVIAILTAIVWYLVGPQPSTVYALVTAMAVLIIACPCALGLATPISIVVGIGRAAQNGVLIRNGEALQQASQITTVVFDKTGTLTVGTPAVTNFHTCPGTDKEIALRYALSLEQGSQHPLAHAITDIATEHRLQALDVDMFQNLEGFGLRGKINDKWVIIGNRTLMTKARVDVAPLAEYADEYQAQGKSIVFLACEHQLMAVFAISDPIREDARTAIKELQTQQLRIVMLTGDHKESADFIAAEVGIDTAIAEVLPHQKLQAIKNLQQQGEVVAMVGDGINDAPALTQSHVGIAIGTGSDIAIDSADITLLSENLAAVSKSIQISKATMHNIKQNLAAAFIYNVIALPVAAGVLYPICGFLLSPMIAAAAMALSSVSVVTNANRLRFLKIR